jgi:phage gp36-like protein
MAYSTQADILNQVDLDTLIQLTDDEGLGEIDTVVLARAVADADATIDAYLQGRYTVPLTTTPDKVRQVSADMAIFNLFSRKDAVPENRRSRYEDAISFLKAVATGTIALGVGSPAAETSGNEVDIESNTRRFTRDKMRGF